MALYHGDERCSREPELRRGSAASANDPIGLVKPRDDVCKLEVGERLQCRGPGTLRHQRRLRSSSTAPLVMITARSIAF